LQKNKKKLKKKEKREKLAKKKEKKKRKNTMNYCCNPHCFVCGGTVNPPTRFGVLYNNNNNNNNNIYSCWHVCIAEYSYEKNCNINLIINNEIDHFPNFNGVLIR